MDTGSADIRQRLRALPALAGPFPPVDFSCAPASPQDLFLDWLDAAIHAGIREPHAMTLCTVDEAGCPDARVLILKSVDERGWHFASSGHSPKGRQIQAQRAVALNFYWKELGRQVRIRGVARPLDGTESAQDFLARSLDARAGVLLAKQSAPLESPAEVGPAISAARKRLEADTGLIAPSWHVYAVAPSIVEFWQGAVDRLHQRLCYQRDDGESPWRRQLLWP